jgi:hypothetical protein
MKLILYFSLFLFINIIQILKIQSISFIENSFKKSYLNLDNFTSNQKIKDFNYYENKLLEKKLENNQTYLKDNKKNITNFKKIINVGHNITNNITLKQENNIKNLTKYINNNNDNNNTSKTKGTENQLEKIPLIYNLNEELIAKNLTNLTKINQKPLNLTSQLKKDIRNIVHHLKNETIKTHIVFNEKLESLKDSIKDSFNQILILNQKNQLKSETQNIDMFQNIDNLVKNLVKNVTKNQNNEIKNEIKSIMPIKEDKRFSNEYNNLDKYNNKNNKNNNLSNSNSTMNNNKINKNEEENKIEDSDSNSNKRNNDSLTKEFLSNVINQLISHPLHIREKEIDENNYLIKNKLGNLRPNIMIISNSNSPRIKNKNTFNNRSHNVFHNSNLKPRN